MRLLITGATGFVGQALSHEAILRGYSVLEAVRRTPRNRRNTFIADINGKTDWAEALNGVDSVVHLAARVHVMRDTEANPLARFREVNVDGTFNLAQQAAAAGVSRFIFLSSVKVNGEFTEAGQPFTADDLSAPENPYGVSKYEAENLLRKIASETGMEVVIIRAPLVYGPSVKANFGSMMRWLSRGLPLPLAAVTENRRSLVALDNLVDLIMICLYHPAAANQTFLASDGEDLSTAELLKRMGAAMGRPAHLFYLPPALLKLGATALNKTDIHQRLCGSLQLDIAKTRDLLGWTPPVSMDEGLRRTAEGFLP